MATEDNRDAFVSVLVEFSSCSCSRSASSRGSTYNGTYSITIELDEVANEGQTTFYEDEIAYVRVTTDAPDYECVTTGDHIRKVGSDIPETIVEDIVFANTAEASLSGIPAGAVSYEWIGQAPAGASPIFDGVDITLRNKAIGLLRCTYQELGDRFEVTNYTPEEVAVIAYVPDYPDSVYLTIEFESAEEETYDAFELMVIDYCSEEPVPGVAVTLNGVGIGTTDDDGLIFLGSLTSGNYPLIMTKAGYLDSDADRLHNDSIEISSISSSRSSSSLSA